jgi:C4-dicarboxylate transporter DctQ subunit
MDKFFESLSFWIERVLAVAFAAAVILSFVNVVGRYVFGETILWADEIQIYIMIWMAFMGAVVATWRQMHLRMDLLFRMLPANLRLCVRFLELLTMIVLSGVVVFLSGQYAYDMHSLGRLSDVAQVPMWIPHSGVALGFSLILCIALWQLWKLAFRRRVDPSDIGSAP